MGEVIFKIKGGDIVFIMLCVFAYPELTSMYENYGFWQSSVFLVFMFLIIGLGLVFIDLLVHIIKWRLSGK